jgi:5'-3' exonuclease
MVLKISGVLATICMGVKGLWKILESEGALKDSDVELVSLKGKILAIDVSIWLYQFIKSVPSNNDATISPLVYGGLFQRVCKLIHFGIKPIFVFDGSAPSLKKETIVSRQESRKKGQMDYAKIAKKILKSRLKLLALKDLSDSMCPLSTQVQVSPTQENISVAPIDYFSIIEDSDEEVDEFHPSSSEIDTNSLEFKRLPYNVQEQILLESRKRTIDSSQLFETSSDSHSIDSPKKSDNALDFSKAQIEALIKRRKLMNELEILRGNVSVSGEKNISHGRIASSSERKYIFAKNAQAGWSLSLTSANEPNDADAKTENESYIAATNEPLSRSISDVEDDSEFMQMMFGSSEDVPIKEAQVAVAEPKCIHIDLPIVKEDDDSDDGFLDLDIPTKESVQSKDIKTEEISDEDSKDSICTIPGEEREFLPKIILEGLIKPSSPISKSQQSSDNILIADHVKLDSSSDMEFEDDQEYSDFIEQVAKQSTNDLNVLYSENSSDFKDLVDKLQAEIQEFNSLKEASVVSSVSPTKVLIDTFMEMLHHFQLPFVVAPYEAEAQCVAINGIDGIISDDSDCLLFGAESVYRGFFGSRKQSSMFVHKVSMDVISKTVGINRNDLIILAYMLGCDYCTGIDGIGPKRALELVRWVKGAEPSEALDLIIQLSKNPESKYYNWLKGKIPNNFADPRVTHAFLNPIVTPLNSCDLNWGKFDCESLKTFMAINAKWPKEKTARFLQDLTKKTQK